MLVSGAQASVRRTQASVRRTQASVRRTQASVCKSIGQTDHVDSGEEKKNYLPLHPPARSPNAKLEAWLALLLLRRLPCLLGHRSLPEIHVRHLHEQPRNKGRQHVLEQVELQLVRCVRAALRLVADRVHAGSREGGRLRREQRRLADLAELGLDEEGHLALHGVVALAAAKLRLERPREHHAVGLGARVARQQRIVELAGHAGDVHDGAALALLHARKHHVRHVRHGRHVQVDQALHLVAGQLLIVLHVIIAHAHVVDQDANVLPRQSGLDLPQRFRRAKRAKVQLQVLHADALGAVLVQDRLLRGLELALRARNQQHVASSLRQLHGHGLSDAIRGPSHHRPLPIRLLDVLRHP
eukprot:scaffold7328_cov314-Pinguiococcus_pyrenoidosus.AAC.89